MSRGFAWTSETSNADSPRSASGAEGRIDSLPADRHPCDGAIVDRRIRRKEETTVGNRQFSRGAWLGAVWLFAASVAIAADLSRQPGWVSAEFLYETAPFPSCHASTIAETPQGLVAAFFGGTDEKEPDVGIWVVRHVNGRWTAPVEVANGVQYLKADGTPHRHPCWNPVLFQTPGGKLLLFYKCGPNPDVWWGMWMSSSDAGKTWTTPVRLPERIDGPVKNKPVLMPDGSLLCGSSTEDVGWRVHFERLSADGKTWSRTDAVNDGKEISAIQPSILVHGQGRLQALGRTRNGKLFEIWSDDGGKTWGNMTLTSLPNPSAGTDAVTLADGRHLLVYNHTAKGRTPLNVAVSTDGKAWQAALVLENQPGEYSYPAVIQTHDGLVHITYTWKRERIRHVVVDPTSLKLRPINDGAWPAEGGQ